MQQVEYSVLFLNRKHEGDLTSDKIRKKKLFKIILISFKKMYLIILHIYFIFMALKGMITWMLLLIDLFMKKEQPGHSAKHFVLHKRKRHTSFG